MKNLVLKDNAWPEVEAEEVQVTWHRPLYHSTSDRRKCLKKALKKFGVCPMHENWLSYYIAI